MYNSILLDYIILCYTSGPEVKKQYLGFLRKSKFPPELRAHRNTGVCERNTPFYLYISLSLSLYLSLSIYIYI